MKKFFLTLVITLAVMAGAAFGWVKYGWRLSGFQQCTLEDLVILEVSVDQSTNTLHIRGTSSATLPAYVGCLVRQSGGKVQVGIRMDSFLGFVDRNSDFAIEEQLSAPIDSVYLRGGDQERQIWPENQLEEG